MNVPYAMSITSETDDVFHRFKADGICYLQNYSARSNGWPTARMLANDYESGAQRPTDQVKDIITMTFPITPIVYRKKATGNSFISYSYIVKSAACIAIITRTK